MTRFDGQDETVSGQVAFANNVCGGAKVAVCVCVRSENSVGNIESITRKYRRLQESKR